MAGGYRRSRTHKGKKAFSKSCRTRRRQKDLDQVHDDLKKDHEPCYDEDLPGGGLFPCRECSRQFQSEPALQEHLKGKLHKKRLKLLKEAPYTHAESEAAGGLGTQSFYERQGTSIMQQ